MGMLELIICEMLEAYTLNSAEHRSMGFDSPPGLDCKQYRQLSFIKNTAANFFIPSITSPDYTTNVKQACTRRPNGDA